MIAAVGKEASAALAEAHAQAFEAPWSAAQFAALMENPAVFALMAEGGEGLAVAWTAAGDGELLTVGVAPAARRRGLGAALVSAAAARAAALGARALHLEVAEDNAAAQALYRRLDFAAVGRRRNYYSRPGGAVDALVLRLALDPARG